MVRKIDPVLSFDTFSGGGDRPLWAYKHTEVTTHAFLPVQDRLSVLTQAYRLMPAILAGDHTASTADAFFTVEFWENHCVPLQHISRFADGIQRKATSFLHM